MRENIYGPENRVVSAKAGGRNVIFSGSGLYRDKHNASFTAGASANWYEQVPRVRSADDEALLSLRLATTPAVGTAAGAVFDKVVGACVFPTVKEWTEKGTIAKIPNDVYRCFCTYFLPKLKALGQMRENGRVFMQPVANAQAADYGVNPAYCLPDFYPYMIATNYYGNGSSSVYGEHDGYSSKTRVYYGIVDQRDGLSYTIDCAPCGFYYSKEDSAFFVEGTTIATEVVRAQDVTFTRTSAQTASTQETVYHYPSPEIRTRLRVVRKEVEETDIRTGLYATVRVSSIPTEDIISGTADIPCICEVRIFGESATFPGTLHYSNATVTLHLPRYSPLPPSEVATIASCAANMYALGLPYTVYSLWWLPSFNTQMVTPMGLLYLPEGDIPNIERVALRKATERISSPSGTVEVCTEFVVDLTLLEIVAPREAILLCPATIDYAKWGPRYTLWNGVSGSRAAQTLSSLLVRLVPSFEVPSSVQRADSGLLRLGGAYAYYVDFSEADIVYDVDAFSARPSITSDNINVIYSYPVGYDIRQLPGCSWMYSVVGEVARDSDYASVQYYPREMNTLCFSPGTSEVETGYLEYHSPSSYSRNTQRYLQLWGTEDNAVSSMLGARYIGNGMYPESTTFDRNHVQSHALLYASSPILRGAALARDIQWRSEGWWTYHGITTSVGIGSRTESGEVTDSVQILAPFNRPVSIPAGEVGTSTMSCTPASSQYWPEGSSPGEPDVYTYFLGADCSLSFYEQGYDYEHPLGSVSFSGGTFSVAYAVVDVRYGVYSSQYLYYSYVTYSKPSVSSSFMNRSLPLYYTGLIRIADKGACAVAPQEGVRIAGDTVLTYQPPSVVEAVALPEYTLSPSVEIRAMYISDCMESAALCTVVVHLPAYESNSWDNGSRLEVRSPFGTSTYPVLSNRMAGEGQATGSLVWHVHFRIALREALTFREIPVQLRFRYYTADVKLCSAWFSSSLTFFPALGGALTHRFNTSISTGLNYPYGYGPTTVEFSVNCNRTSYYNKNYAVFPSIGMMTPALEECYEELGEAKYSVVQGYSAVPNGEGYAVFATPVLATKALFSQKALIGSTGYSATISVLASAISSAETSEAATALQAVRTRLEATATEAEKQGAAMAASRVYEAFIYAFNETLEVLRNDFASVELMFLMAENRQSFALLPISAKLPSTDSLVKILS